MVPQYLEHGALNPFKGDIHSNCQTKDSHRDIGLPDGVETLGGSPFESLHMAPLRSVAQPSY